MEVFRTDRFEEVSLSDWLAHSPIDMVAETLNIDSSLLATSSRPKSPFENRLKGSFDRDSSLGCGHQRRAAEWPRSRRRPSGIRAT
jgi:hypothetical protein